MPKDEDVWGALIGLFLGLIGAAILAEIFKPRCPKCGKPIQPKIRICPHCGAVLEW